MGTRWLTLVLMTASGSVAAGCGDDSAESQPAADGLACPAGELELADGSCQVAGLPADLACPPGELELPDGSCLPAGVPPAGCGEGFAHDGDGGCAAILPDGPCLPGQMAIVGETVCREVAPCGTGPWGTIPTAGDRQFVDQSYAGGDSDGSQQRPWTTVADGVSAASAGATVAIAEGSYAEDVVITSKPIHLWGRCPALVEIVGTGSQLGAVVIMAGADGTEVRNLALRGGAAGLALSGSTDVVVDQVWAHDAAGRGFDVAGVLGPTSLTIAGSLVELNGGVGVLVEGAQITIERSVVRDTQAIGLSSSGQGISVRNSASGTVGALTLRSSLIDGNRHAGVMLGGAVADIEATVIRGTQTVSTGLYGRGLNAVADPGTGTPAVVALRSSLIDGNHEAGLAGTGSQLTIDETVVRGTHPDGTGAFGRGVEVHNDEATGAVAALTLRSSLIEDNHSGGVVVAGCEGTIEATIVRDTMPDDVTSGGVGVRASDFVGVPAKLAILGSAVLRSHQVGVIAFGSETTIEATLVSDTQLDQHGIAGRGLCLVSSQLTFAPATFTLRSSIIEGSRELGAVFVGAAGSIESSIVRDTDLNGQGQYGRGVQIESNHDTDGPSNVTLRSSIVERSHGAAVGVVASLATVEGSILRDILVRTDGAFGDGVMAVTTVGPAEVAINGTWIDQSARAAVSSFGALVHIAGSALSCQAFDLDGESYGGNDFTFGDLGGNTCGCPLPADPCRVVSASLEAPPPVGGLE